MRGANRALAFSSLAFAISFAVWGLISPMAKTFQTMYGLSEQQVWVLIAAPVLLGSVMRLPMGMLADRWGGRTVFGGLLVFSALPATMLTLSTSYPSLLAWSVVLGMAGTSFSIGVAFTSPWFPPERQGFALGVYGAGNIGQSVALFGVPLLVGVLGGWQRAYLVFAAGSLVWGVLFLWQARDAPRARAPRTFGDMLRLLGRSPMAWVLAAFYFVTFGGFVALSIGLPKLLQELFGLTRQDAGMRVAGFVLLATAARPVGGWLSDRIGGARLLAGVFAVAGVLAFGMTHEGILLFTVGALGMAACLGLGNGAVFKLVPQHFPRDTGTVTGLVGAMGGLGGFFPPLVLGLIKTATGSYGAGFVLLSAFCLASLGLLYGALLHPRARWRGANAAGT
ncbi:MAG: NarK/NasA family nitrate transporter [Chthonomonadales bacterium]|nr:NarK/NasA family nitrate transporter [Chthonomonadales bacterium]